MAYGSYAELKEKKPVRWWHEAIIDDMLLFPLDTLAVRAARLGYSDTYLSVIMNTDLFKAAYQQRKQAFSANMDQAMLTKTAAVAAKGLDLLLEAMETKRAQIPFAVLSDTVDKTLSRLGYGVKPNGAGVNVSVNAPNGVVGVAVSPEQLAEARQALRLSEQRAALSSTPEPSKLLDVTPSAPEPGES